jgi:alpha 1,2-mannosyltransferase
MGVLAAVIVCVAVLPSIALPMAAPGEVSCDAASSSKRRTPVPPQLTTPSLENEPELKAWQARINAFVSEGAEPELAPVAFPSGRFRGKGIVMSAGGRGLFAQTYVLVRHLRETLNCTLPIEVFYAGAEELPHAAIDDMERRFDQVRLVDAATAPGARGVQLRGYQMKGFAMYLTRFESALWLDGDNFPVRDPRELFEAEAFADPAAAVLWPDVCNMISVRPEAWVVFGEEPPPNHPVARRGKATTWVAGGCVEGLRAEVETGQILLHKKRAWPALRLLLLLSANYATFFQNRLFHGDKQLFFWALQRSGVPFHVVRHQPYSVGLSRAGTLESYVGNTLGQRHPDTGELFLLHRSFAKFDDPNLWKNLDTMSPADARAWSHMAVPRSTVEPEERLSWNVPVRSDAAVDSASFFSHGGGEECLVPTHPSAATLLPVGARIIEIDDLAVGYFKALVELAVFPRPGTCNANAATKFFCKHS